MDNFSLKTFKNIGMVVAAVLIASGTLYVLNAAAFNGAPSTPSSASGAIGSDSANNGVIGTSPTDSHTKLFVVGSAAADTSNYALKVVDSASNPILYIRNDGSI